MKVRVSYSDGHYSLHKWQSGAGAFVEITDSDWRAYEAFEALGNYWHGRLRDLDNEQFEKEQGEDKYGKK